MTEKAKKLYKGRVVSNKMDKTVVAVIERTFAHKQFDKVLRSSKKYKVHDERNEAKIGDVIEFYQTRPLSKTKYMRLHRIVTAGADVQAS